MSASLSVMDYSNLLGIVKLPLRSIAARLEFSSTTLQDAPTGPEHVATVVQAQTAREQRDVQRTMEHWRRNTWGPDCIPLLDTFDFSPMRGDWGYRFLICGDGTPETLSSSPTDLSLHSCSGYRKGL